MIAGIYFGFRFFGKSGERSVGEEKIVENPNDAAPPLRSSLLPAGILAVGAREVNLSLVTNELSYCRYSTKADQSYITMSKGFSSDKNKPSHSVKVSGLGNNKTYKYYVRCRDLAGNKNEDDALIEFSIGAASVSGGGSLVVPNLPSEAPPVRSNLLPSGALSSGTTKTTISLLTNEPAYCRYSINPETLFDRMDKGFSQDKAKLQHMATASGLTDNKVYKYYVRCRDLSSNKNNDDAVIQFSVGGAVSPLVPFGTDTTAPGRFSASPTGDLPVGTRKTNISLKTDEIAVCRYSNTTGVSYDSMGMFSNTDSISHSTEILGLSEGASYKYYVRCVDRQGNKNTNDFIISFKVEAAKDEIPPIVSNPSHTGDLLPYGMTSVVISISTDEIASCRYSTEGGVAYTSMKGSFSYYDGTKKFHVKTITGLAVGKAYDFFVRCKDLAGNVNTGDALISFSVDRSGLPQ